MASTIITKTRTTTSKTGATTTTTITITTTTRKQKQRRPRLQTTTQCHKKSRSVTPIRTDRPYGADIALDELYRTDYDDIGDPFDEYDANVETVM